MHRPFSAAIRGGLIEAPTVNRLMKLGQCFPPQFAAASLKLGTRRYRLLPHLMFSAAIRGGLIEAVTLTASTVPAGTAFSAAIRGGLIEAWLFFRTFVTRSRFSAAIRGGLIEAIWRNTLNI